MTNIAPPLQKGVCVKSVGLFQGKVPGLPLRLIIIRNTKLTEKNIQRGRREKRPEKKELLAVWKRFSFLFSKNFNSKKKKPTTTGERGPLKKRMTRRMHVCVCARKKGCGESTLLPP